MTTTTNQRPLQAGDKVTDAVRLVRPLAEGGMGRVWIAEHLGLNAQVVVKLMAPEMAARPDGAERFAREAAVAAAIKSPHVVQVFDHGVRANGADQGTPYIVMELLEGKDLGAYLAEHGRMEPARVATLVVQIGKALSRAHKASIVHRDIKPDNIFLCDTDGGEIFVKLLDFGTAKRETRGASTTVPGQIMGTPYYMSPEQSVGSTEIDERSDIWSLGIVAFEALTGMKPFDGGSVGAITMAIHGPFPKITAIMPELPPAVDAWFARACAQAPGDRFASVSEAASAFVEAVTGAVPIDAFTESVLLPMSARAPQTMPSGSSEQARHIAGNSSPPVEIVSLAASLPDRGGLARFTTIAAGVVMVVAAIAMVAIVLGRSPAPPPSAGAEPPPSPSHASEIAPSPPPPVAPAAAPEPKAEEPESAPVTAAPAKVTPPSPAAVTNARVKAPPARGARTSPKAGADDDLVRLTNAAAKHAVPASEQGEAQPAPAAAAPAVRELAPAAPASPTPAPQAPPLPPPSE